MDDHSFFTTFLNVLLTTQEANELIERIDTILARIYRIDQKSMIEIMAENMNANIVDALEYAMKQNNINAGNQQVIKTFLQRLQSAIRSCEVLSITIAVNPTQAFLMQIGTYSKQLFGETTLIEINVDTSVIGGGIVIYKGRYVDQSLKKKLDEYFSSK